MKRIFVEPFSDVMASLEHVMGVAKPFRPTCIMLISLLATWFIYVPIHELLHVVGCVVPGGTVTELQIDAKYGGAILANVFDFVTPASQYAGRLTGFDTQGSDWIYLATVFGPFILTIIFGVPLMRICTRRKHPILFGSAVVIGLAPFYQIANDYFEMGSITVTRVATLLGAGSGGIAFEPLRSDDVFRTIEEVFNKAPALGLDSPLRLAAGVGIMLASFLTSVLMAFVTYYLGSLFSRAIGVRNSGFPVQSS
jgi:hypothetical protein